MSKKSISFVVCLLLAAFFSEFAAAQVTEGIVHYTREASWVKIRNTLPFLSQEEKDRAKLTWGDETWKEKYLLKFKDAESLYMLDPDNNAQDGWSYRPPALFLYGNRETGKKLDVVEMLGKTFTIEDSLTAPVWKIQNQIKEVAGHICMKAVYEDTIKNQKITAWFAQDLPLPLGPENYFGLPGLILEVDVNNGCVVITAEKIEFVSTGKDVKIPKSKGKKVSQREINDMTARHIKDSMKAQRNPYWAIRY